MNAHPPSRLRNVHRLAELTLTAFFWILWLYLITPLLSLLMWLAGYELFVEAMIVRGGYEALIDELRHYGLVILGILLTMLTWVQWNLRRYGAHNHRTHPSLPVVETETAGHAGLPLDELKYLQSARSQVVAFTPDDQIRLQSRSD